MEAKMCKIYEDLNKALKNKTQQHVYKDLAMKIATRKFIMANEDFGSKDVADFKMEKLKAIKLVWWDDKYVWDDIVVCKSWYEAYLLLLNVDDIEKESKKQNISPIKLWTLYSSFVLCNELMSFTDFINRG